eukprot:Hpha_TRINITY_DN15364_c4_g2::TRINITY_DN15364_c4_g2_i2::g.91274::m.91274
MYCMGCSSAELHYCVPMPRSTPSIPTTERGRGGGVFVGVGPSMWRNEGAELRVSVFTACNSTQPALSGTGPSVVALGPAVVEPSRSSCGPNQHSSTGKGKRAKKRERATMEAYMPKK